MYDSAERMKNALQRLEKAVRAGTVNGAAVVEAQAETLQELHNLRSENATLKQQHKQASKRLDKLAEKLTEAIGSQQNTQQETQL